MSAQTGRLPDHILDAEVLVLDSGTWFAHAHEHRDHPNAQPHTHRHDHRRRSKRGDYDHHVPVDQPAERR
jgi:hypothetical protein